MDRNQIKAIMNDIYTSSEAAGIYKSPQRLNQLVHDKQIEPIKVSKSIMLFFKEDLKKKMTNVSNNKNTTKAGMFNINNAYVQIYLYYTINNILITMIKDM
ncbi:MAG: hypothetical protein ACLR43_12095 [Faecalibacillus faecis]